MKIKDPEYLEWIRTLPCLICGDNTSTEAAHIRYTDLRYGKINSGMGAKPHDRYTVPLCGKHHREQHTKGEREWWTKQNIDPLLVASALYSCSGDTGLAEVILQSNRKP